MTWEILQQLLATYGPGVALAAVFGWAYWRKDQQLQVQNDAVLELATGTTEALVGFKDLQQGIKEVLVDLKNRMEKTEDRIGEWQVVDRRLISIEEKVEECKRHISGGPR